jgi:IS66 C-terminal element
MATLIVTAKLNDVDPQAWLADVLARVATHPAHRLDELLPWNWAPRSISLCRSGRLIMHVTPMITTMHSDQNGSPRQPGPLAGRLSSRGFLRLNA